MAQKRITDLTAIETPQPSNQAELSALSSTAKVAGITISAAAADNSLNDAAGGFLAAGLAVGDRVGVSGFATASNNLYVGTIATITANKITFGADGDALADEAAGASVTVAKWTSRRASLSSLLKAILPALLGNASKVLSVNVAETGVEWIAGGGGGGGGGLEDAPSDGKLYGRKDGSWVEIVGGGSGGGTPVSAVVRSRTYNRKAGTQQTLTWIPQVGNFLVVFAMGNGFGGNSFNDGWFNLGRMVGGSKDGSYVAARIVVEGDTQTITPTRYQGDGVCTLTVFEIDAAYIPEGGLANFEQASFSYSDTKFPTITFDKSQVALLATGGQAGNGAPVFVLPPEASLVPNTLVNDGYVDGRGILLVAGAGQYNVTYSNFDSGFCLNATLMFDTKFA